MRRRRATQARPAWWRSPRGPHGRSSHASSSWTTKRRSATPSGNIWSIRATRSRSPATGRGGPRDPAPAAEDHGHPARREPAWHQRDRPGAPDPRAGAQRPPPDAHGRQRRHVAPRSACSVARSTTSSSRSTSPISAAPSPRALEQRHTLLEGQRITRGSRRRSHSGAAERRLEQADTGADLGGHARGAGQRARGQGPLPARALRPGRRPLGQRRGPAGLRGRGDRDRPHRRPAARHRQDRHPRGDPEQARAR